MGKCAVIDRAYSRKVGGQSPVCKVVPQSPMDNRPIRVTPTASREAPGPRFAVCMGVTLVALTVLIPVLTLAQGAFTDYSDVESVLTSLTEILPPELKSSDLPRRKAWPDWVTGHDRDIRERLMRGDEDTIVNWLLFGTSFTQQPRAFFDGRDARGLRKLISQRTKRFDFRASVRRSGTNALFSPAGCFWARDMDSTPSRNGRGSNGTCRRRSNASVAERQQYMLREDAVPGGDVIGQIMVQSTLFRDRGLSLDTSILASFADRTSAGDDEEPTAASAKPHSTRGGDRAGTRFCGQELGL